MLASFAVLLNSLPLRLIHLDATPRLRLSMLCSALPLHCVTKPCLASATLCCSMLCSAVAILFYAKLGLCNSLPCRSMPFHAVAYLCNSPLFHAIAHHRHSMPPQFNAILFYADAIRFVALPLRLFCISVQLALCSAAASLAVLLLHYAYASLNVTNPRCAYAFQRLTKP